jgi:CRP/FNR family transcriptional regulator, nitrogen oxide reductase regulator
MAKKKEDESKVNILWRIPMFNFLDQEALDKLLAMTESETFAKGEYIFMECDASRKLYIVTRGEVKQLKQTESGREMIIELAHPGDIFGEEAVFDGKPYPLTAQCLEDCEVLSINRSDFFDFLRANPDLALEFITEFAQRLRLAQDTIRALAAERVEWRVGRVLNMLAARSGEKGPDGVSINLPITRQDIADMAGTTVETTIRVISHLKKLGICDTVKGKIVITDPEQLGNMVREGCTQPGL